MGGDDFRRRLITGEIFEGLIHPMDRKEKILWGPLAHAQVQVELVHGLEIGDFEKEAALRFSTDSSNRIVDGRTPFNWTHILSILADAVRESERSQSRSLRSRFLRSSHGIAF